MPLRTKTLERESYLVDFSCFHLYDAESKDQCPVQNNELKEVRIKSLLDTLNGACYRFCEEVLPKLWSGQARVYIVDYYAFEETFAADEGTTFTHTFVLR